MNINNQISKYKITIALSLEKFTVTYVQDEETSTEETITVVEEKTEDTSEKVEVVPVTEESDDYEYDFSFFEPTELDTVVKYRTQPILFFAGGFGNVSDDGAFANSDFGYLR